MNPAPPTGERGDERKGGVKIAIGADHGGYKLKQALIQHLKKKRHKVIDAGAFSEESCDYPLFAKNVSKLVSAKKVKMGMLICKSGLGMSIAANRAKGIRAALCHNVEMAKSSRRHNDANILVIGAKYVKKGIAKRMSDVFVKEKFSGGRHLRRINMIDRSIN